MEIDLLVKQTRKIFLLHGIHKTKTDKYHIKDEKVADETHKDKGLRTLGVSG